MNNKNSKEDSKHTTPLSSRGGAGGGALKHTTPLSSRGGRSRLLVGAGEGLYICLKELKNVLKDQGVLMFLIIVPLAYPLLYSWIYNNEVTREVPVAVVDRSHSQMSREFTRMLDASPDTKVAVKCNSLEEAKDRVGRGDAYGVVYFPEDFQTRLNRMEQTHVGVYCDMSLMLAYKAIFQTCTAIQGNLNSKIQIELSGNFTNRENEITTKPLDFEEVPIFNNTAGYGNFIIPGVLILIIQQTLLLGVGMAAGTARERNNYGFLVPVDRHYRGVMRIIWGKAMAYFMIYTIMAAYLLCAVPRIFNFISLINGKELILFCLPFLLACIFFSMTLSALMRYRENVMLLVVFSSVPLLFMSGVSWPQSNIPSFWQGVSWLFPSTFGIRGFVRMNSMGATLTDVATEYRALWIQVVVYFVLAHEVYRFQIGKARQMIKEKLKDIKNK